MDSARDAILSTCFVVPTIKSDFTERTYPTTFISDSALSDNNPDEENHAPAASTNAQEKPNPKKNGFSLTSAPQNFPNHREQSVESKTSTSASTTEEEDKGFHNPEGISYSHFLRFIASPLHFAALQKEVERDKCDGRSATLFELLRIFPSTLPDEKAYQRAFNSFHHATRDLRATQDQLSAYAADSFNIVHPRSHSLLGLASRSVGGVATLVSLDHDNLSHIFRTRHSAPRSLFESLKSLDIDKYGRRATVESTRPSPNGCRICFTDQHATLECFEYFCAKCLHRAPRHSVDACPVAYHVGPICQLCRSLEHWGVDCPVNKCARCNQTWRYCATSCRSPKSDTSWNGWELTDDEWNAQSNPLDDYIKWGPDATGTDIPNWVKDCHLMANNSPRLEATTPPPTPSIPLPTLEEDPSPYQPSTPLVAEIKRFFSNPPADYIGIKCPIDTSIPPLSLD